MSGSPATAQRARHMESRQGRHRLDSVVSSSWKQSQAVVYLPSTDVNTYVLLSLSWDLIVTFLESELKTHGKKEMSEMA